MASPLRALDLASSALASLVRGLGGVYAGPLGPRPAQPLVLYEFESCPFCRKVREVLTWLDLEVRVRPCPKGGTRFRPEVEKLGGRLRFPFLVDPAAGDALYESDVIVRTLVRRYGNGHVPGSLRLGPLTDLSSSAASLLRGGRGTFARPSRAPSQELELWASEGSPSCRAVRETLCSLELPYRLRPVGRGSPRRAEMVRRAGRAQLPFLADPGRGVELFEARSIQAYLEAVYRA